MEALFQILVALSAGSLLGALLVYWSLNMRFQAQLQGRLRESSDRVAGEAVRSSRATVKGQIGERFAPLVPGFGYEPADARFLGSPVDYVVFDGLTDGHVRGVAFVEVKTGSVPLTLFQKQVKQAIDRRDVTWRTVQLPD
ncbi:MAG: Holliday junction resolvase-like protein [Dehalococcoidia bacterium]|nr:Holliday junction resolvase-like protein [Dehalococcoidia bacterium]